MIHSQPILRVGQIFSICPFHLNNGQAFKTKYNEQFLLIAVANISIQCFHMFHSMWYSDAWVHNGFMLLVYIDFVCSLIMRAQAIVIIIESFTKRSIQIEMINLLSSLNSVLTKELKLENIAKKMRFYVYFVALNIFFEFSMTSATYFMCETVENRYYILLFILPNILKCLHFNLSLIFIYSLKINVQLMKNYLRKIRLNMKFGLNEMNFDRDLIHIKNCYGIVWRITKLLNEWRLWSLVFEFGINLVTIVCSLFWCLVHLGSSRLISAITVASGLMWSLVAGIEIFLMCNGCMDVANAVK